MKIKDACRVVSWVAAWSLCAAHAASSGPASNFHDFAAFYLEPSSLSDPHQSSSGCDPDGDGWSNRFEYFFQTDPMAVATQQPFAVRASDGDFTVSFRGLKDAPDMTPAWQRAGGPDAEWSNASPAIDLAADLGAMGAFDARFDMVDSSQQSVRLVLNEGAQNLNLPVPADGTRYDSYAEFEGPLWPTNYGSGHVALWHQDKLCAYSITIDDNNKPDFPFWLDVSATYGWKLTWFVIVHPYVWDIYNNVPGNNTGYFGTLDDFRVLREAGHDIQLHGNCGSMNSLTAEAYEDHVTRSVNALSDAIGAPVITFAYPCGALVSTNGLYDYAAVISNRMIGARGTTGGVTPVHLVDYNNTSSLGVNALVDEQPGAAFSRVTNNTRPFLYSQYRGWCVTLYHGMSSETARTNALATLDYVKTNEHLYWVAPFTDVAKYAQERESHQLDVRTVAVDRIEFRLTDRMNDVFFDHPLTVKFRLDASWTGIAADQNGASIPARLVPYNGDIYGLVEPIPDRGPVVMTRGP